MVVGWQLASHMRTDLVLDALRMAIGTRGPGASVTLVHHSDRGSQYTSGDYTQELTDHGVLASVGSVGDAYDNAMAESFVDSLKTELTSDRVWRSRSQLELAVVEYVAWFNHDRLHESLGDIPPAEFEALDAVEIDPDPGERSPMATSPKAAGGLSAPRLLPAEDSEPPIGPIGASTDLPPPGSARPPGSLLRAALDPTTLIDDR